MSEGRTEDRIFPEKLIPPGINDERTRAVLAAFEAMANEFDFRALLMRNSSEIPDEALPLAIHDFSLEEFIPADGLPPRVIGRLIDRAWELHEAQGTDGGVQLGLSLLGIVPEILHWWQQKPQGHHDTHRLTVFVNELLFEGEDAILGRKTQTAAHTMVDATKRWSQDTDFRTGIRQSDDLGVANAATGSSVQIAQLSADVPSGFGNGVGLASDSQCLRLHRFSFDTGLPGECRHRAGMASGIAAVQFHHITFNLKEAA